MTAVILAAGVSSRLRPLTDSIPKCLLPIRGVPLLRRTLDAIRTAVACPVVVVGGYHAGKLREFLERVEPHGSISFVVNPAYRTTGNNYSLWLTKPFTRDDDMLLLDADILFDVGLLTDLLSSPYENALLCKRARRLGFEEVKVELDAAGRVTAIGKEIDPRRAAGESVGIEHFSRRATRELFDVLSERKDRNEFYEASFQAMVDAGTPIHAVNCGNRPCIEIDTPADLLEAEQLALEQNL